MPYKDPKSPAAIESARKRVRKYEESHREERREQKRERYWLYPEKARERNKVLKDHMRSERRCVRCGEVSDYKSLCSECAPKQAKATREWYIQLRKDIFAAYGGPRCACCGIETEEFLTIDHINGGGSKHRQELGGGGVKVYAWIKRMGFPGGFRVLCQNCNHAFGKFGYCPHERERINGSGEPVSS